MVPASLPGEEIWLEALLLALGKPVSKCYWICEKHGQTRHHARTISS